MKKCAWLLALVLFAVLSMPLAGCGPPEYGPGPEYIEMAFVPYGGLEESATGCNDLVRMIEDRTGLVVDSSVAIDFSSVREAMGEGEAQIGWLDTFNYVLANEEHDVDVALVTERDGSTTYQCQLNVRADSGITTLEDLKGKVMCWVDSDSTSRHIIPRILLQAHGLDPDNDFAQTLELSSHDDVIMAVYNGHCDVGVSYSDARNAIEQDIPDVKDVIIVLATSADIPNDSISFTEDFPAEAREQIVKALLEISATEEGRAALEAMYSISDLVQADDSLYDGFRADLENAGIDIKALVE